MEFWIAWEFLCDLGNLANFGCINRVQRKMHMLNSTLLDLGSKAWSLGFDVVSEDEVTPIDSHAKIKNIGIIQTHPSNNPRDFVHGHTATAQNLGSLKIRKLFSSIANVYHNIL
jgi:hypothetical protein